MELRTMTLLLWVAWHRADSQHQSEYNCWKAYESKRFPREHMSQAAEVNNAVDCINHCKALESCGAAEIDRDTNPKCWYQSSETFKPSADQLADAASSKTYLRQRNCETELIGVDLNCWLVRHGMHMRGLARSRVHFVKDCLDVCIKAPNCRVVDWDRKGWNCFYNSETLDKAPELLDVAETDGVTNFILDRECHNWIKDLDLTFWKATYKAFYGPGGLTKVEEPDLKSCLWRCHDHPLCKMFEYALGGTPSCWIQDTDSPISRSLLQAKENTINFYFHFDNFDLIHVVK